METTGTPTHVETSERPRRRRLRRLIGLLAIAGVFALVAAALLRQPAPASPRPTGRAAANALPTPVTVTTAQAGEIPLALSGLGTVTASATVTVRTRVDGQLMRVAFTEGQVVKAGEVLAEIDPRPFQAQLDQAEGQLVKDRALLENARRDLERYRSLIQDEAAPRQQYDTQASLVTQLEGTVRTDEGQVASARLQLTYCHITAPLAGRIGLRLVDPGNIVHASDPNGLLVITAVQPIAVVFTVPEDAVPDVLARTRAGERLRVDAFNRDGSKALASGRLLTIDNQIDATTGTARLKAMFDNPTLTLFPNQFVNVRLQLGTHASPVIVPSAAVRPGPQGPFVFLVDRDRGRVHVQRVTPGVASGDRTAIDDGLTAGATIVLQRRPDIAAAERRVAAANAQIGVARAAYFPAVTLSGSAGFESATLASWIAWPSRVWSLGASVAATLLDGGARKAGVAQARASYDQTVAEYRQTVLQAFEDTEDNLAALRILADEARQQDAAVAAAKRSVDLATVQYKAGIVSYLQVVTAQTALLDNELNTVAIQQRRLAACVQLITALGGGWKAATP